MLLRDATTTNKCFMTMEMADKRLLTLRMCVCNFLTVINRITGTLRIHQIQPLLLVSQHLHIHAKTHTAQNITKMTFIKIYLRKHLHFRRNLRGHIGHAGERYLDLQHINLLLLLYDASALIAIVEIVLSPLLAIIYNAGCLLCSVFK